MPAPSYGCPPSLAWKERNTANGPPPGTELNTDGWPIGRDPRTMTQDELKALGHEPMSALAALRAHCLDCCGGSPAEVRYCVATKCPSWPFRMGKSPWRAPMSEARLAAARERARNLARAGKSRGSDAGTPPPVPDMPPKLLPAK